MATHAYSSKHGALLEIVERMELDEASTDPEEPDDPGAEGVDGENADRDVQRAEHVDQRRGKPVGEEL